MSGCCRLMRIVLAIIAIGAPMRVALAAPEFPALSDVVITAGDESLRLRLWVTVDGEPITDSFARSQTAYVERLFGQLDLDDDGRLSSEEASHAPSPQIALPESVLAGETENVNVAFNFRAVDENGDGHATFAELLEFYHFFGDGPIRIRRQGAADTDDDQLHNELWVRLDENNDERLSFDELSSSSKLASLDRNGNEVLEASELSAPILNGTNVARQIGETINYRIRTTSPNSAVADMNVTINYPATDGPGSLPEIHVEQNNRLQSVHDTSDGTQAWRLGGAFSLELQADCGPLRVLNRTRRVLALEFRGADEDSDGSVAADQRLPEYLAEMFPLLDGDGDGVVSIRELDGFTEQLLPLESDLRGSQISLDVISPRNGIFAVLDTNHDGRLGRRELLRARARGEVLDGDGDGSLTPTELRSGIRIEVRRRSLSAPYSTEQNPGSGPVWFTRMDRNRDGDVSPNEFLASGEFFARIDINGDGLIGLSEALQVESLDAGAAGSGE